MSTLSEIVETPKSKRGYVYVLQCFSWFKIGCSVDPQRRALEFSLPDKKIIHTIACSDMLKVERSIHTTLCHRRLHDNIKTEWFALSEKELSLLLDVKRVEDVERFSNSFRQKVLHGLNLKLEVPKCPCCMGVIYSRLPEYMKLKVWMPDGDDPIRCEHVRVRSKPEGYGYFGDRCMSRHQPQYSQRHGLCGRHFKLLAPNFHYALGFETALGF